jgi:hypothetical protein
LIEAKLAERPLILSGRQKELVDDPDREFLLHMVEHGLSLTDEHTVLKPFDCKNYKSAYENATMVNEALAPDLETGRLFEPPVGISSCHIHAVGAVPKTAHSVRVIHDHSRPYGSALNESLSQTSFSFASVDDAIKLMRPGSYMAKVDIEAAYWHVPIDPADWDKLAFRWPDDRLLFDAYLQFGLKNACEVFHRISSAITRILARRGIRCIVAYVDDFLIVCSRESDAWIAFWCLRTVLHRLDFKVNMKIGKSVSPCQL